MNTGIHELLSLSNLQLCPSGGGVGCCAKSLVVPGSQHTCHVVGEYPALVEYFPWSLPNSSFVLYRQIPDHLSCHRE